ncbi:MAG: hypothetical protein M1820_008315 [Bogoriella megaspora]|nr:MAG: hypothetical protein M1820_008315 [Bogoriella megaspora]
MNMVFTWDPTDLCIIFKSWHIRSTLGFILSLFAVAALTAGYELVRELSRRYESFSKQEVDSLPSKTPNPSWCYNRRQ